MMMCFEGNVIFVDKEIVGEDVEVFYGFWGMLVWLVGFIIGIYFVGFIFVLVVFFLLFFCICVGVSWGLMVVLMFVGFVLICVMVGVFNCDFLFGLL